jgi:hypothetical protein
VVSELSPRVSEDATGKHNVRENARISTTQLSSLLRALVTSEGYAYLSWEG